MNWMRAALVPALACLLAGWAQAAGTPAPDDFAWRASLELPAGASLVRVALPAQALLRSQSRDLRDLRVFNAAGEPVAFVVNGLEVAQAAPAAVRTPAYPAYVLQAQVPASATAGGTVQLRIDAPPGLREVWVQLGGTGAAGAAGTYLPSAIFATQKEKRPLRAITVQAQLPANVPVQVTASTSTDLTQWTPVPLRGRLYRFEGVGAPANDTLEFAQPLQLEGRYLRLDWEGFDAVHLAAVTGTVAQPEAPPPRLRAALPAGAPVDRTTLEWRLDFATPVAGLALASTQPNSLVPLRVLGRNDAAQPWRELGQTVVYRLGSAGAESSNPPLPLGPGVSVRELRVVAGNGMEITPEQLTASVEFVPLQVVFLASGSAPYRVVVGRPDTAAAALGSLPAGMVPGQLEDLPQAHIVNTTEAAPGPAPWWPAWLPVRALGPSPVLWAVLVAAVVLLAGVAVALLRQLRAAPRATDARM